MPEHGEAGAPGEIVVEDLEIARFQAALLEVLHLGLPAAETHARLLAHPDAAPFSEWVASFEPRALEVASVITRKFGVRTLTQ